MAGMAQHGWKWLELAGNGWNGGMTSMADVKIVNSELGSEVRLPLGKL